MSGERHQFDKEDLLDRLMGDHDFACEVIETFLQDIPQQLIALQAALSEANGRVAGIAAHSIKGAAANVGSGTLSDVAARLETVCKGDDLPTAQTLVPELTEKFAELKTVLLEFTHQSAG